MAPEERGKLSRFKQYLHVQQRGNSDNKRYEVSLALLLV